MPNLPRRSPSSASTQPLTLGGGPAARLRALARARGQTPAEVVEYLLDFYELGELDDLGAQLRALERRGPTLVQIAQLSMLYTILSGITRALPRVGAARADQYLL